MLPRIHPSFCSVCSDLSEMWVDFSWTLDLLFHKSGWNALVCPWSPRDPHTGLSAESWGRWGTEGTQIPSTSRSQDDHTRLNYRPLGSLPRVLTGFCVVVRWALSSLDPQTGPKNTRWACPLRELTSDYLLLHRLLFWSLQYKINTMSHRRLAAPPIVIPTTG